MKTLGSAPRWLVMISALMLAACASFLGVFVSQHDTIRAPHERHQKADVECATCHETIFDSATLQTRDMPKEKVCLSCHKEEKEKGQCAFCHSNPEHPLAVPTRVRDLKMNHMTHLELVKEDCGVCHKSLPEPFRTEGMAPKMAACLGCHEHQAQYDSGRCEVCHQDLTKFQLKPVSDFTHQGDFLKSHRLEARAAGASCANCHDDTFCAECHAKTPALRVDVLRTERVDRAFIHRNDFLGRHAIEASANESTCQTCHGINFCTSCHAKSALTPSGTGLDPHPAGFGQGNAHGPAARRDIVSCAACHDQGATSTCVTCHRVGGAGGNPHPPSFMVRHSQEEIGRNAMCQVCHL